MNYHKLLTCILSATVFSIAFAGNVSATVKQVKISGYITNIISPTVFEIDDIKVSRSETLTFTLENQDASLLFKPEDLRIGTEIEVQGMLDDQTNELKAGKVIVDLDQFRKIKNTTVLTRTPDGSIMKINTFNQPDVESAKVEARKLTEEYEEKGELPAEQPFYEEDGIKLFSDDKNVAALDAALNGEKSLANYLKAHLSRIEKGDYFAVLGYLEMSAENENLLQSIRHKVLHENKSATCLGFGPRFLHSTGQGYKGGANNGVFLQITSDDAEDFPVPEQKYTFGVVKAAQARGDFQVLLDRDRRALRVHLGADVKNGLEKLNSLIQ